MLKFKYDTLLGSIFLGLAFISIFNKPLSSILNISFLNYFDEAILVLCLLILGSVLLLSRRVKTILILVFGFFVYSVVISMLFGYNRNFGQVLLQSLINIKFLIILLTFIVFFQAKLVKIQTFLKYVLAIALIGFLFNVMLGSSFNHFFDMQVFSRPNMPMRYGGFLNPNHMAFLMALYIGVILNKAKNDKGILTQMDWLKILGSILIILLTDSRSAIVGVLFFFIAFYWEYMLRRAKIFLSFLAVFAVTIVLVLSFTNMIQTILTNIQGSFSLESYYIRGIIINMAVQITYLHFPIGTGAATFGSVLSDGSQVYEFFGVAHRSFFVEKRGIYDSSIASIMGEYGMIGILFFALIFYKLKSFLLRFSNTGKNAMLNGLFAAFLFYSFTNPTFTNNIYILLSVPIFMNFVTSNIQKE